VRAGGSVTARGPAYLDGTLRLASDADGTATYTGEKQSRPPATLAGVLVNAGHIDLSRAEGADKPAISLTDSDYSNDVTGVITGPGVFTLLGDTSFTNMRITAGTNDWNGLDIIFDGAIEADGDHVSLEASSTDVGPELSGLSQGFSFASLCLIGGSKVMLQNLYDNNSTFDTEVMYVGLLGVDDGSELDLNGLTLYYEDLLPGHGLNNIVNGTLVHIPAPGAGLVGLVAAVGMAGRRRWG